MLAVSFCQCSPKSQNDETATDVPQEQILVGAESLDEYLPLLEGKKVGPVSYTHLDVYKRQLSVFFPGIKSVGSSNWPQ